MKYQNILTELEDGILIATINRPRALNALNRQTFTELHHLFAKKAPAMTDLKGIVVTGAGDKAFVAGADISEFETLTKTTAQAMSQRGHDIFRLIEIFPKPVIAAVNGFALGGGCELAMACHMRIAADTARFGQPEVNLGIIPGYGGTQRLTQLIGKGKALELLLTGDMIKAPEALNLGLVNHVVPLGMEVHKAKAIIEKIASKAPIAVAKIVACVDAYFDKNTNGFRTEVEEFGNCAATKDFKEGASAFLGRRKATFVGK